MEVDKTSGENILKAVLITNVYAYTLQTHRECINSRPIEKSSYGIGWMDEAWMSQVILC